MGEEKAPKNIKMAHTAFGKSGACVKHVHAQNKHESDMKQIQDVGINRQSYRKYIYIVK